MKAELAEQLIGTLMNWDRTAFQERVRQLDALAVLKLDEYGNFRPGVKFFESLASWLDQFDDEADRATALEFVLERLLFISDAQMTHLIELVYPDHIEPVLRLQAAEETGFSPLEVCRLQATDEFVALRRRSLILGASDGARLDRLRRSAEFLSHEQFLQGSELPTELVLPMCGKLDEALGQLGLDFPATFAHIFLVDDFSGSGETLIRKDADGWKGKLHKLHAALQRLQDTDGELISANVRVTIVLYIATDQARRHLETAIAESPLPPWEVRIVQALPDSLKVDLTAPAFAELTERYYDEVMTDVHKGRAPLGYGNCNLPVVMSHNTPNNSVTLLWAETPDKLPALGRRALFPRYERHHRDRP